VKHLATLAVIVSLSILAVAGWWLVRGDMAFISGAGLRKLTAAASVAVVVSLLVRFWLGWLERRHARRWALAAHPLAWVLGPLTLLAASVLWLLAYRHAAQPSRHGDWSIGIYVSSGREPLEFQPLGRQPVITADHVADLPCAFVADPVLVPHEGGFALFYEAWNTRSDHGDICLSTSPDGVTWSYEGRVLDESCSLSYPTVFEHDGDWYMVPESRELGQLRLYRATNFPRRWVFDRVLLEGARYRDTNVVFHGDHWFLLTVAGYGRDLLVFVADDPRGPWRPHPGNPVVQDDLDHARGGGSIVPQGGGLLRFTQDVSPYYGNRVRAVRITRLTPSVYRQVPLGDEPVLVGHDAWNTMGMHMLSCVPRADGRWLAAVDGHGRIVDTRPDWR
jgi:hypothetical protein